MKKIVTTFLAGILVFALAISAGCTRETLYPTYEDGFFVYYKPPKDEYVEIVGLTELGHQQKVIVVPETIGGYKYRICDSRGWGVIPARWGDNNTLEKIYFEYDLFWGSSSNRYFTGTLQKFSKLNKIIINNQCVNYDNILTPKNINFVFSNELYSYRYNEQLCFVPDHIQLANVQFLYNYDNAPNEGYYWIDDIDDGEKIEIIPPDPKREGYTFEGWYCEPECENIWSFDTTIYKKSVNIGEFYPDDYVTYVYAKWDKK
ncbi:MAG: InlB B-repeat-containing protein [Clostridia bacterium]|nr:InlB B-repeat-containing protein [Clostridia bacterium]